jgi:alpha-D-ribose 1-methylphosphonate 5-triphosphate synthase subunit PhnI
MPYVATKGGEKAIQESERLYHALNGPISRDLIKQIVETMPYLVDRVMGEGSLYSPELAALALAQSGGDLYEAVLLIRAYRSTQPRIAYAQPLTGGDMLTMRRISAAFKDIPGGQILGPSLDYSHRILHLDLLDQTDPQPFEDVQAADQPAPQQYPMVADWLRQQGLIAASPMEASQLVDFADIPDVTREPLTVPAPRAHRLQSIARADTGGVLALGYASMRGYGFVHPTVNELRLAYAEVQVKHPVTGAPFGIGRIRVSQGEIVSSGDTGYRIGFAASMGWNEVKLIAGATLDLEMTEKSKHPALSEDFILYHTEPIESSGFCIHFKLPHYVTFSSSTDSVRKVLRVLYSTDAAGEDQDADSPADVPVETAVKERV